MHISSGRFWTLLLCHRYTRCAAGAATDDPAARPLHALSALHHGDPALLLTPGAIVVFHRSPIEAPPDVMGLEMDVITLGPGHA